jgi:hypothetical protein
MTALLDHRIEQDSTRDALPPSAVTNIMSEIRSRGDRATISALVLFQLEFVFNL